MRFSWALGRGEHFSLEVRVTVQPGRKNFIISGGRMAGKIQVSVSSVFLPGRMRLSLGSKRYGIPVALQFLCIPASDGIPLRVLE